MSFDRFLWPPVGVAALALLLTSCAMPRVDLAHPQRLATAQRGEGNPPPPTANTSTRPPLWPVRTTPTVPSIEVVKGTDPVDRGIFGKCRVVEAGALKRGKALLIAGVRDTSLPEPDEPFSLTVVGPKKTNELKINTENHRITLALLKPAQTEKPRGLVLYISSIMLISPEERRFLRTLEKRGWNVAALTPSLDLFAEGRWDLKWKEKDTDRQASILAREIDDQLAETAYAAEALLGYLRREQPDWVHGPRVVIGSSAGSLAAPALIKRTGLPDAAVFIGGGSNIPEVLIGSDLEISEIEITLENENLPKKHLNVRKEEVLTRLKQTARDRSRLEPLHHLPLLRSTPTLMLSGERDKIVPAHTGEMLYHALGSPERWRYPIGHILLFLNLPFQANRIADWIEQQVPAS